MKPKTAKGWNSVDSNIMDKDMEDQSLWNFALVYAWIKKNMEMKEY